MGDRFYLFGGRGIKPVDIFVPATGKWTSGSPPPLEIHHFQVRVIDGKMYAAGGRRSAAASGQPFELTVAEVDVYDFAPDTWT